ncbi:MAG: efflux RND transporter periplasmic adaptor subunit [Rikenellaceae bacterium]|jgi:RND family efflux transporter MFP subunit|nr:efflux RND transporter periplasmic adaptor subunit [Rikenellaceae bacterium]
MKKLILIPGAIALAALVMTGCGTKAGNKAAEADSLKTIPVKTTVTKLEMVEQVAEFTGNIEANVVNNIGPNQPVRINRILVDVGAVVGRGQLLVEMDPANYIQANVQLVNTEQDYERMKSVYEAGGVSKQQVDQLETQVKVLRTQVANLKENIELRSPISGVVTERRFDAGDMYTAGGILTVMQINPLKITMNVSEQYFPIVKRGMSAEVNVDLFPDKQFKGSVSLIYPAINPATRTFTVELTVPNSGSTLRPGMYCRATLRLGEQQGILLTDLAVQKQIGTAERYVYVIKNGVAERRVVTIGRQVGNYYHVLTGLEAGEEVVISGSSRLSDGTAVNVVK